MPKVPNWVFILISVLYLTAIRVDTMDVDASQYAEMSREMLKSGDYLHLYDRGMEYLDKPPFLFWVSMLSMKIFGINNFGYKLPSILFAIWALYATYRLARLLYDDGTARIAALVLATCQGMFLMTNDVRCDTILMSCVISAIWLIQEWLTDRKLLYLITASIFIATGMMTKGPLALMVPVFAFASNWILRREWKNFFQPAYLLGLAIIAILLIPMSIGLYQQFDMHPGKIVDGKHGVSGLRFFYWSQSFGRITGESPWKNDVNIFFLLQNMLWSFLPWIVLFVIGIVLNTATVIRQKFRLSGNQEWLTTGGFLLTYVVLGSSAYQLPHYIFVAYPLAAIVTARLIYEMIEERKYRALYRFFVPFQAIVIFLIFFASLLLLIYSFPANAFVIAAWTICFAVWIYVVFSKKISGKLLWVSAAGFIVVNIFMTNFVYVPLLKYQAGSQTGRYMHEHSIPPSQVAIYKIDNAANSIHFYAGGIVDAIDNVKDVGGRKYLVTMDKGLDDLKQNGISYDIEKQGESFKVSELTPEFLNPNTRKKEVKNYYLVKLK